MSAAAAEDSVVGDTAEGSAKGQAGDDGVPAPEAGEDSSEPDSGAASGFLSTPRRSGPSLTQRNNGKTSASRSVTAAPSRASARHGDRAESGSALPGRGAPLLERQQRPKRRRSRGRGGPANRTDAVRTPGLRRPRHPLPRSHRRKTPTPKTWGDTADAFAFGEDYGVPEHEDADEEDLLQDGESGDGASHPLDTPAGWTQESPVREISAIEPARLSNSCGIAARSSTPHRWSRPSRVQWDRYAHCSHLSRLQRTSFKLLLPLHSE